MACRIRWEGHGVYRRFYGTVTASDFRSACEEISNDPRFDDIRYVISDFVEAQPGFGEQELRELAHLERRRFFASPDIVNAIVADDRRILGCVPYIEDLHRAPCPTAVFATVDDARHWIAGNPRLYWLRRQAGAEQLLAG